MEVATSLADPNGRLGNPLKLIESARALETAGGVAVGFVVAGVLTYLFQHFVQFRPGTMHGRIYEWCPNAVALSLVDGAQVVAVGTAGPGAGAVFHATAAGTYSLLVPPGLYIMGVILAGGRQVPAMVLTPRTADGSVPLSSSLELIYDVQAQAIMPESGEVTVDLVTSC